MLFDWNPMHLYSAVCCGWRGLSAMGRSRIGRAGKCFFSAGGFVVWLGWNFLYGILLWLWLVRLTMMSGDGKGGFLFCASDFI